MFGRHHVSTHTLYVWGQKVDQLMQMAVSPHEAYQGSRQVVAIPVIMMDLYANVAMWSGTLFTSYIGDILIYVADMLTDFCDISSMIRQIKGLQPFECGLIAPWYARAQDLARGILFGLSRSSVLIMGRRLLCWGLLAPTSCCEFATSTHAERH